MSDITEHETLLDGIKVLDFTHVLAGPMCTRILADLGVTANTLHYQRAVAP